MNGTRAYRSRLAPSRNVTCAVRLWSGPQNISSITVYWKTHKRSSPVHHRVHLSVVMCKGIRDLARSTSSVVHTAQTWCMQWFLAITIQQLCNLGCPPKYVILQEQEQSNIDASIAFRSCTAWMTMRMMQSCKAKATVVGYSHDKSSMNKLVNAKNRNVIPPTMVTVLTEMRSAIMRPPSTAMHVQMEWPRTPPTHTPSAF